MRRQFTPDEAALAVNYAKQKNPELWKALVELEKQNNSGIEKAWPDLVRLLNETNLARPASIIC